MSLDAYAAGAAYVDGRYMPVAQAAVPVTHFGWRRSDVTYDVVGVWEGSFFRLDDHLARFAASRAELRMTPDESDADLRAILHRVVALSGLRSAYVSMECLRGAPAPGQPRHPAFVRPYILAFAIPWVTLAPAEMMARGMHLMVSDTLRIPPESVEPRAKNFHWGDMTRAQFEALEAEADYAVLPDREGNVTEGPGFNVFSITDGVVATPVRGGLDGITRLSVMELCDELGLRLEVRAIPVEEFRAADEIFTCTTAGGIMPASRIDGRRMNNDRPGPISTRLLERFWEKRAEGWHATPVDYAAAEEMA
ncbi:aminotransferase class IV [Albimonas pacifica]|uniref:Probable branched-chain-amino-acid aminotransferase n=1 Tax=Albimonas pacifica TaxID=1114924 RepID=A0A1I3KWV2_9RHOB|nr:aminotransferase class IV [Albimonas pacifica]SFI76916.1 branched chain amino acid aminotransferase apoenzyme [Albimonas pacifica]